MAWASYISDDISNISSEMTVYVVIELAGTSTRSWEEAVRNVVETASQKMTNLRIAEVVDLDAKLEKGGIAEYRAKVRLSFEYEREMETL
jgi:flavin-binding protein dodecin